MPAIIDIPRITLPASQVRAEFSRPVPHRRLGAVCALLTLAGLLTLLNCAKPLQVDDAAYVLYASQIAENPLLPYGFEVYWNYKFQSANEVLAPPVFLYWLAVATAL